MRAIILLTTAYRPLFAGTISFFPKMSAMKNDVNRARCPVNQVCHLS
jgi:hypothetical protein